MRSHFISSFFPLLLLVLLALPTAINGGSNVRGGGWAELPSDQDEEREQKPRANSETTTETTDDTSVDMDDDANVAIAITSEEDGVGADPLADGDIFTQAESIDYFKDIDPEIFEWVNKDNVKGNHTTCGFLKPDLGSEPDVTYPKIKVYMCVQFATIQPAPKGNVVVHCGGPASLSDCANLMGGAESFGQDNVDNYNIISIDQRGMGRSEPSFAHYECVAPLLEMPANGITYTKPEIQLFLDGKKDQVKTCWTCKDCGFHFNATREDGTVLPLHFLEYSGTRQLAEDLLRFMFAINAPKLSLYGISYGTTVMATFATIFPNYVDKFVIDSNVLPGNQLDDYATSDAIGVDFRLNYMTYTCWAAKLKDPESCPVDDLPKCLKDLNALYYEKKGQYISWNDLFFELVGSAPEIWGQVCEEAAAGEVSEFIDEIGNLLLGEERGVGLISCDNYDQPTTDYSGYCFGVPADQYFETMNSVVPAIVNGMDYANSASAYNDKLFINEIISFQEKYESITFQPAYLLMYDLSMNYFWPKNIPLPIRGSPNIRGIVAGQLYDSATPYTWTSTMRENFPLTNLLTSQSVNHGLVGGGEDGPCQKYIVKYFEDGDPSFVDGTVCGDPYPYFDNNLVR